MNLSLKKIITRIIPITLLCINGVYIKKVHADTNSWNFDFVGQQQTFTVPYSGTYELETWGSQGGGAYPGKGGYSKGEITLSKGQTLYVYVGGQGGCPAGGWNGGGNSGSFNGSSGYGGGGATDIRINGQALSDRIIVAGGGGGGNGHLGGSGGGLAGQDSTIINGYSYLYGGGGGTQISGGRAGIQYNNSATSGTEGSLGQGGAGGKSSSLAYGDGGGGGYYGGGGAGGAITGDFSAGGGSSYIGGVKNGTTIAGNKSMYSPNGANEIGHTGNGYVRIMYQGPSLKLTPSTTDITNNPVTITVSASSSESEIEKIQTPDGNWINASTTDYIVDKNGTYSFTAVDKEGRQTTKSINIDNIISRLILNVEPEKGNINLNEIVSTNLVIDNITEIAAEDITIKYDNTKLQFLGYEQVEGIMLAKIKTTDSELRFILVSKGANNIVNSKKVLLKINFKGIATGNASIDVASGMVSDGIKMKKTLEAEQCGESTIKIAEGEK